MRGETLVIPDLSYSHKEWNLTYDEQTRCLSYMIRHLRDFCIMPKGLKARVTSIPSITKIVRLSAAEGYPGISLYEESDSRNDVNDIPDPFELERKLDAWITETGKQRLLELSAEETLTWQDVVEDTDNRIRTSMESSTQSAFEGTTMRLERVHKHSSNHRSEILSSEVCGCFYCTDIFPLSEIIEWVDEDENGVGKTALCPHCGIDSVIASTTEAVVTPDLLRKMHKRWF